MIVFEYVNRVMAWHQSRDRGASAVEYALILGAIIAVIGAAMYVVGTRSAGLMTKACTAIGTAC